MIEIDVLVVPRASRERIGPMMGGRLKIALTAPPVEGAANDALVALLARTLGVSRSSVAIVRGEGSRRKTVRIDGIDRARLDAVIGPQP
jgi:uncharacterized protein (TIGR00251 family)